MTCPCALSLATPVAVVAATGSLTRLGLLTTRGHALETLARATHMLFDKTGTLTRGELRLHHVRTLGRSPESGRSPSRRHWSSAPSTRSDACSSRPAPTGSSPPT